MLVAVSIGGCDVALEYLAGKAGSTAGQTAAGSAPPTVICSALPSPSDEAINAVDEARDPALDGFFAIVLDELEIQDACYRDHPDQPRPNPNAGPS